MPSLSKSFHLEITVEQFLNACSVTELHEVDLLLGRALERATQRERKARERFLDNLDEESGIQRIEHVKVPREHKTWMMNEVNYLKQYYGVMPVSELIKKLDRSKDSIIYMVTKLGLKKRKEVRNG